MSGRTSPVPSARPRTPSGGVVQALPLDLGDDAALARAAAARHPAAARVIWERFAGLVRGLMRRIMGPAGDVDDLVQETFLQFFSHVHRLRDPSRLSSFVVGIAMRVARSELRRRRVRRWLHLTDTGVAPDSAAPGPTDHAARQALERLYAVLDRVDDRARLAFVLRHVEGLELVEVAEALGCSLATAKRRLGRCDRRVLAMARSEAALRPYLGEPCDE
ncbi:MAG: sigma-70 family RNA polymerase sigma factor [Polyangiaceae bacterium]|nr:sigma-70 family RNA polymerase sigma factor [Polyangiaceae bacterium]